MMQKWYQKASVQVAMVTATSFIIIAIITIAHQRSELRQDNKRLESEIEGNKTELQDLKQERNKLETQLAPFLAIATRNFPDAPKDQRLDKLSEKLDRMMVTSQNADRNILLKLKGIEQAVGSIQQETTSSSTQRIISEAVAKRLTYSLKDITGYNLKIGCVMGDTEGFALAEQIKDIFGKADWRVAGVRQSIFSKPVRGLIVEVGKAPPTTLQRALLPLFDDLGYPREANLNPKLSENTLKIIVGGK